MKNSKIPTLLGVISVTVGLIAGVLLVENEHTNRLQASVDTAPKNVRVSNVQDTSITISWTTPKKTVGAIIWKEEGGFLDQKHYDEESSYTHFFNINSLSPSSRYHFEILSDGNKYDNSGLPWEAQTGPKIFSKNHSFVISGTVVNQFGMPQSNAIVYATVGGSSPLSTTTSSNGSWVMSISEARSQDLRNFVSIDEEKTIVELNVQTGKDASTAGQLYPKIAGNIPPIIIGRVNNFRNAETDHVNEIPKAEIVFPESNFPGFGELLDTN